MRWMGPLRPAAAILVLLMTLSCGAGSEEPPTRSVLLVVIDTWRADRLGAASGRVGLTPGIDSLASRGTLFTQFQAQSSWTLPATASILTGRSPREHGAVRREGILYGLSAEIPSLVTIMHGAGYRTCGLFNVIFLSEDFGFHRGFDSFDSRGVSNRTSQRRADETVDSALAWLDGLQGEPFLLVVHLYDPHVPYDPPPPYDTMFTDPAYSGSCGSEWGTVSELVAINEGDTTLSAACLANLEGLYDGEVAFTDHHVARLLAGLRSRGLSDSTLVVVTADHGEEFMEHGGVEHGRTLYQEVTRVPLVMSGPGVPAGEVVSEPCCQMDLLPTIGDLVGLDLPEGLPGGSVLRGEGTVESIPAGNLLWSPDQQVSVRRGDGKLIWSVEEGWTTYFDLSEDPHEQSPLPMPDSSLMEEAMYYWATPPLYEAPEVPFGETMERHLRDLGYIR